MAPETTKLDPQEFIHIVDSVARNGFRSFGKAWDTDKKRHPHPAVRQDVIQAVKNALGRFYQTAPAEPSDLNPLCDELAQILDAKFNANLNIGGNKSTYKAAEVAAHWRNIIEDILKHNRKEITAAYAKAVQKKSDTDTALDDTARLCHSKLRALAIQCAGAFQAMADELLDTNTKPVMRLSLLDQDVRWEMADAFLKGNDELRSKKEPHEILAIIKALTREMEAFVYDFSEKMTDTGGRMIRDITKKLEEFSKLAEQTAVPETNDISSSPIMGIASGVTKVITQRKDELKEEIQNFSGSGLLPPKDIKDRKYQVKLIERTLGKEA